MSRTQRFTFRPIELTAATQHLKSIAKQEKITIDDGALELVAQHGNGSFRDSISLLDQLAGQGKPIDRSTVEQLLGLPSTEAISSLADAIVAGEAVEVVFQRLTALLERGFQAPLLAQRLSAVLRQRLVAGEIFTRGPELLMALLQVPLSHDPETHLEAVILQYATQGSSPISYATQPIASAKNAPAPQAPPQTKQATPPDPLLTPPKPEAESKPAVQPEPKASTAEPEPTVIATVDVDTNAALTPEAWQEVLNILKKTHNTLYGIVRMATPSFENGSLHLGFRFAFHQKRANESKNRDAITNAIVAVLGSPLTITCEVIESSTASDAPAASDTQSSESLAAISNIFGGGELLQSE